MIFQWDQPSKITGQSQGVILNFLKLCKSHDVKTLPDWPQKLTQGCEENIEFIIKSLHFGNNQIK